MSDTLEKRVADAIGQVFTGNGGIAVARREAARAVLAIIEADKAEAVEVARQQALEGAAQAISANATRYTDEYLTTKAVASRLRRLAAEAGITVDAHTEES